MMFILTLDVLLQTRSMETMNWSQDDT